MGLNVPHMLSSPSRERASLDLIGAVDMSGMARGRMPAVCEAVKIWCQTQGWDGAVWTDLEPNFRDYTGHLFTLDRGHRYIKTLSGENLREAYNYIENAPEQTQTPMRSLLRNDPWWQGLAASV